MSWFTELEEVVYSTVEYIPLVGTVYSVKRAMISYSQDEWQIHWQSVANAIESSIRDIVLLEELTEPVAAVILHTMAESFTDKVIEIYHREPKKPEVPIQSRLKREAGHVLVVEPSKGHFRNLIFGGIAKGVHHFHGAAFTGTITHPTYAPDGEKIRMDLRQGFYDGAQVTFSWKWAKDYDGNPNKPEATFGIIFLQAGTPTKFGLSKRKGDGRHGGWEGYNFWGIILSKDKIVADTKIGDEPDGKNTQIVFRRVSGT